MSTPLPSRVALAAVAGALFVNAPAHAQRGRAAPMPAYFSKLAASDSLDFMWPELSPDGRWVLFATYDVGRSNLWVVPVAGGRPTPITTGAHVDTWPTWFPSGDRIAFVSDRTRSIMSVGFDPKSGQAVGTPRRIGVEEPAAGGFGVSPDGSKIVYVATPSPKSQLLRIVPAIGGPATTLLESPQDVGIQTPRFASDGRWIYYLAVEGAPGERRTTSIVRVAPAGGMPEKVATVKTRVSGVAPVLPLPDAQRVLACNRMDKPRCDLLTFGGDTVASFTWGDAINGFATADPTGRHAVVVGSNVVAPIRVVSLDGSARTVTDGRTYDWPFAWSADSKNVLYSVGNDSVGNGIASVDGTTRRFVRLAPKNLALRHPVRSTASTSDLRYTAFLIDSAGPPSLTRRDSLPFYIYDSQTRLARLVSSRASWGPYLTAGGDWYGTNNGEFIYGERSGDSIAIRGARPAGETRLIRTFALPAFRRSGQISIRGDDIAYQDPHGDSTTLFVAHGAAGVPKALLTIRGRIVDGASWSPDGKWLAATVYDRDATKQTVGELALIPVDAPAKTRYIATGDGGYEPVWTRDGTAVFYLRAENSWTRMDVWRYPLRADEPPQNVTQGEPGMFWGFELSPDGRSVAIPEERNRGSTLWRVDLEQAAVVYRDSRGKARQGGRSTP